MAPLYYILGLSCSLRRGFRATVDMKSVAFISESVCAMAELGRVHTL